MTTAVKFKCSYTLDQRVDKELANFNQETYRFLQSIFASGYKVRYEKDGMPNAVDYFLLYNSALLYGAADAVLTLVLHNLGREARILERQAFEYWVRATHYASNPDAARLALYSTPFQEKRILDDLGYDKNQKRYRRLARICQEVQQKVPDAENYREPPLRAIINPKGDPDLNRFYALHYRVSSQMAHATSAGVGGVWNTDGLSFDSRQKNPNYTLVNVTIYLLAFLTLLSEHMSIDISAKLSASKERWNRIQQTLKW